MELNSKVSHQVRVFNSFKYFQLICSLLDCFVIIWLEPDLVESKEKKKCHYFLQISKFFLKTE